ncbi:MAG: peptidylprolyl isomerase [Candidatus Brocadiaceae bacterium]|uniref:foldase protein PrsA n=1 Tax=Candidatus Wunengus sp. YC61 TaxID=3367698 RepID=UPI0027204641|nr:peptidylprolyl isomerase [Candidatus Brocadiaceae bacterium]
MLKGWYKPLGVVLGGILCIQLSAFAAEKETKKSSVPAKKTTETSSKKETTASKEKEAAPAKQEDDSKKVLATVNGENVSQEDVNQMLNRFGKQVPEEQMPAVTKQILDGLITQKLIMQFIRDSKIEVSQAEIEKELNKVREDIKTNPSLEGKTLEQVLETHGSSIDTMKSDIIISLSLEKNLGKDIDDKKTKAYFDENKAAYDNTERRASHILVDTRQMKTDAELAQALEKIKKIKTEVDSGKDFAEVAKQYSDCPSKDKGGDLNFFKRKGQMVEPFAAAAFALKVGQVSDPVKTPFGYHIIKVTEIKKGNDVKFDDVKQVIKQNLMEEKAQVLIKQLLEKAKIEYKT